MKMTEYPAITEFTSDNILITDGNAGTKKIGAGNAVLSGLHLAAGRTHRMIYRGKDLGDTITDEQKTAIAKGDFNNLWLGDYWTINGVRWDIVDFNYWYNRGDTACTAFHAVIMPHTALYTAQMNPTDTSDGGYVNSAMYKSNLEQAKTIIASAFGTAVLSHREYLCNAASDGTESGYAWFDSTVELPNELMIFGTQITTPRSYGTIDTTQLGCFMARPASIAASRSHVFSMRDVASIKSFAAFYENGRAYPCKATDATGVRPVFGITYAA